MSAKQQAKRGIKIKSLLIMMALCGFLAGRAQAQSSEPPQIPPYPDNALMFYPLETPPWTDLYDDPAKGFTNLNVAPSWDYAGTAVSLDTNCGPYLQYEVYQDGYTNVILDTGSLSIFFQANWTSITDGGTGPTNWATLLSIGHWTSNAEDSAWTIAISPEGTNLIMEAQSEGTNQTVFNVPVDIDAGDWHSLTLTYSSSNCCLYLEGQLVTNAPPIEFQPSYADCTNNGFFVGSVSTNGNLQFHGQFQWLATYDYPLSAREVADDYAGVSGFIQYWGGSLPPVSPTGGFNPADDGPPGPSGTNTNYIAYTNYFFPPTYTLNSATDYAAYTNFWLAISNSPTTAYVTVESTLSNLTYVILTNASLPNSNGWGVWQILPATNNVTPAPALAIGTNSLFFEGVLEWSTTTNGLPDYWCMEYFDTLNVDPYADPDGDGLCNLDEFTLGTDPTNAHSVSSTHTDAEAKFLAYTNDVACLYHISITNGLDTNTLLVTMWPTQIGTNYQIYSFAETNGPWIIETNFLGTNTNTTVAIYLNGRTLSLIGGDGEDQDGDGLPSGYEVLATHTDPLLPDTGLTGTPDGYKDPDGDGYLNLQEMYNGTDPLVFNTPAGAQNPNADFGIGGTNLYVSWQPASGLVTGYVIYAYDDSSDNWLAVATNSATQLSYTITNPSGYGYETGTQGKFAVAALYANGPPTTNSSNVAQHPAVAGLTVVHGPGGKTYVVSSAASTNILGYTNYQAQDNGSPFPEGAAYGQIRRTFPSGTVGYGWSETNVNIYILGSQFTNGIAELDDAQAQPYMGIAIYAGPYVVSCAQLPNGVDDNSVSFGGYSLSVPFIDGTEEMKQNIHFLLRAGGQYPFGYISSSQGLEYSQNYVYSSCYDAVGSYLNGYSVVFDHFAPFQDNYFFANFVFNPSLVSADGTLETGYSVPQYSFEYYVYGYQNYSNAYYEFPTFNYVTYSNAATVPGIISSNQIPWVGYYNGADLGSFGGYSSGSLIEMSSGITNCYGLTYNSLELTLTSGGTAEFATLSPSQNVSGYSGGAFYADTAEPELQTLGYYFARPGIDPMPELGDGGFSVTNETPSLILGSVGTNMQIAGYAKQEVLNGASGVYAYLGQYFTNAFVMTNGNLTTNSAGILSEYGEFFPTVPGHVGLLTKADPDQSNLQGTNELDIIRLSLDVNHDGTMDESFTGPDNTSSQTPYVFWANNDYDRYVGGGEDDVQTAPQPDCNYSVNGHRCIPCPRDLEDYARLWVSGVSNTLSRLPAGGTVTLNWGDVGNPNPANPVIDIFQAADADGGIGYLTNLTTASNQINTNLCQYIGRLVPGGSIQLNASTFTNNWAGDHYIWCGVLSGSGQLFLTIEDGSGNQLAQSSQWIQIQDIKQMYERWTIGDDPNTAPHAPMAVATNAMDNFSPGYPNQAFNYSYDSKYDSNNTYIVYVHGWDKPSWEKDRDAETMYKRLYWQGYEGRFGEFRWPCNPFTLLNLYAYDLGEQTAWQCGQPFEKFLMGLNSNYPGKVYVLAHSMGNVVTGEALHLARTNSIVNTYVATQAAISVHIYDNTIPDDISYYMGTPDSEGHYYTSNAPPYLAGIGGALNFVDYYNYNDGVLGLWITHQGMKPGPGYQYETPTVQFPSGYYYQVGLQQPRSLVFTNNTYEIFARATQSYSYPLGAETNIAAKFPSALTVNLHLAPYNFGSQHSFQFRNDNMTTAVYWRQLLVSFDINH